MRKPVQFGCVIVLQPGTAVSTPPEFAPVVPANKTLVIEFITIRAIVPKGQIPEVILQTSISNLGAPGTIQNNNYIAFNSGPLNVSGVSDLYVATHQVKMRAMAGDDISLSAMRNMTTGEASFAINYGGVLLGPE